MAAVVLAVVVAVVAVMAVAYHHFPSQLQCLLLLHDAHSIRVYA